MRTKLAVLATLFAAATIIPVAPAEARVIVREKTKYYKVSGKDGRSLYASIRKRGRRGTGARHAIATTRSKMDLRNVRTAVRGNRCVVRSADLVLDLTYSYPRWTNQKSASPRTRKAWQRFMARVKRHEQTHGRIAKKYARRIIREMKRQKGSVRKGCRDGSARSARRLSRLLVGLQKEQLRFDRREASRFSRIRRLERALVKAR